jgi:O-antigen ligase
MMLGLLAGVSPKLALVAAFGLAFVLIEVTNLAAGLAVFAVVAFLDLLPVSGAAVTIPKAAGLLLVVAWLATLATRREATNDFFTDHPFVSYLLLLFLGWCGASLLWAELPSAGVDNIYRYALNILLFVVAYTAISTRKHAQWVVSGFLVGAMISAFFGILSPAPPESPDDIARLSGAGVEANELAAVLVATVALAAAVAAGWRRSPLVRLVALGVIGFCVFGVILSFSRGGLVALMAALVAAVLLGGRWRPAAVMLLVVVAIGVSGYLAYVASPLERERVTTTQGGTGRADIWAVGWRMVQSSPTNGIGVGQFPVSSIHFLLAPGALLRDEFIVDEPKVAHNIYLEVLAELGVVGLVLFLSILVFSLSSAIRAARAFERAGDLKMEAIARGVAVAVIALLAADFFASEQFSKQLWLLLALGPALHRIARVGETDVAEEDVRPRSADLTPAYG